MRPLLFGAANAGTRLEAAAAADAERMDRRVRFISNEHNTNAQKWKQPHWSEVQCGFNGCNPFLLIEQNLLCLAAAEHHEGTDSRTDHDERRRLRCGQTEKGLCKIGSNNVFVN